MSARHAIDLRTMDPGRINCAWCRYFDDTAYAFSNHGASGRICEHREPYEPDLSPYHKHPRFPYVTQRGSCCRAFEPLTDDQAIELGEAEGRLFL